MGNCSCKERRKKKEQCSKMQTSIRAQESPNAMGNNVETKKLPQSEKKEKTVTLRKNRKVPQSSDSLYKIIFDPEGFSVHDLGLIGQKHDENCLFDKNLKPIARGPVEIQKDVVRLFTKPPKKPGASQKNSKKEPNEFRIVEINDYLDDLYIQLMEPDPTETQT